MREVTHLVRSKYIAKLSTLKLDGIPIPVRDTFMYSTPAKIPLGGGFVNAYVVIKNQIRGGNRVKNCSNFRTQLYLDIVTEFTGASMGSAGNIIKERITDEVYQLLFDDLQFTIKDIGGYSIITTKTYEQPMPPQYNTTSTIFRCLINFTHDVSKNG